MRAMQGSLQLGFIGKGACTHVSRNVTHLIGHVTTCNSIYLICVMEQPVTKCGTYVFTITHNNTVFTLLHYIQWRLVIKNVCVAQ